MPNIGFGELLIILLVLLLLFGARRLPEIGRSLGRSIQEFKRGMKEPPEDPPTGDE
ncbi:MAG: twin-arginine translocase TatA/TatE family subunit [Candidatus Omnitrophica bacterium]|nr:twin-arginine translocase TatA/TatE family subunit [Candidatus Omnitrophota bacterium]